MPVYVDREAPKLWRRIYSEATVEASLLAEKWKLVLAGLAFQYLHGLAAHGVHYLHRPGPTLQDAGVFILPLTGPNYHCREGSKLAKIPPPKNVLEVLMINFPDGVIYGCGDLIFSSHTIFTLVFVRTYQRYGTRRWIKHLAWFMAVIQSLLIIASRKHYTVDIVVAWYTVNLVMFYVDSKLPEMAESSSGPSQMPLLPLSTKDSRNKSKEDHQRLLNENNVAEEH